MTLTNGQQEEQRQFRPRQERQQQREYYNEYENRGNANNYYED